MNITGCNITKSVLRIIFDTILNNFRPDRDQYIKILWDKVTEDAKDTLQLQPKFNETYQDYH